MFNFNILKWNGRILTFRKGGTRTFSVAFNKPSLTTYVFYFFIETVIMLHANIRIFEYSNIRIRRTLSSIIIVHIYVKWKKILKSRI